MTASNLRELWRSLRVGDRIRIAEFPPEFLRPGYCLHRDTIAVYRKLVARRRPLRIGWIDEWKMPWVQCRFRRKDGRWQHHTLAVNHGGIVRVKFRR